MKTNFKTNKNLNKKENIFKLTKIKKLLSHKNYLFFIVNNFKSQEWVSIQKKFQDKNFKVSLISKHKSEAYMSTSPKLSFLKEPLGGKFAVVYPLNDFDDNPKHIMDNLDTLLKVDPKLICLGSVLLNSFHSLHEMVRFQKQSKKDTTFLHSFSNDLLKARNFSVLNNGIGANFNSNLTLLQTSFFSLMQEYKKTKI